MPLGARVFTSNVDGQFQKAGFSQSQIHECHGSIHHLQCINLCTPRVWTSDEFEPLVDADNCRLLNSPPGCPICGELARPNVLMFNDWHWAEDRSQTQAVIEATWLATIAEGQARVVVVEMGAGTSIPSVRHFSHQVSHALDGCIIRINPREPQVPSSRDIGIAAGALDALRDLDSALEGW